MAGRTFLNLVSDVIRAVSGQATHLEARQAIQDALDFVDSKARYDFLTKEATINVVAPYQTGTVSIAAGGTAVTLSGGTWSTGWTYRTIRFGDRQIPYRISSFPSGASATLLSPISGDTAISAGSYVIYQDRHALPADCEPGQDLFIKGSQMSGRNGYGVIPKVSRQMFESRVGYYAYGPVECYTDDEYDEVNNVSTIKLWPYPAVSGEYLLVYYKKLTIPTLDAARVVIPQSFERIIINRAAAQIMRSKNMQGWLALDAEARELLQSLYQRHASSSAFEGTLEVSGPTSGAWANSSSMFVRGPF